jgi:hypothetical protein
VKELCALVNYELLLCGRRREECAKKVWIYLYSTNSQCRPSPPCYRGFMITLRHTTISSTPLDKW